MACTCCARQQCACKRCCTVLRNDLAVRASPESRPYQSLWHNLGPLSFSSCGVPQCTRLMGSKGQAPGTIAESGILNPRSQLPSKSEVCLTAGTVQRFSLGFRGPLCLVCGFTGVSPHLFASGVAVGAVGTMALQIAAVSPHSCPVQQPSSTVPGRMTCV